MADGTGEPASDLEVGELIALVDRLEDLLHRSSLAELEVEIGGTALVLRTPAAVQPAAIAMAPIDPGPGVASAPRTATGPGPGGAAHAPSGLHAVVAPLTGVYYGSPSPGAAPYLKEGGHVSAGQVIGLIEAMKLFNEIKSDTTGIVRRIAVTSGALVKARQTLIEVEPA
jgi:acetyl-CoA carboxylase biotin carboxyl carrier protein